MSKTIVGLYDHISQARAAVEELDSAGFERKGISLVANAAAEEYGHYFDDEGRFRNDLDRGDFDYDSDHHHDMTSGEGAAAGAGIGATIGGLGGLLMGLGLLAVPGVGPALAAGPIVSALVGAGIGAAAGGLMGALVNSGVPEEEAGHYAEGVRRGGSLVMLTVADSQVVEVERIMNRHDPVDIDERVSGWRDTGWSEYDDEADPFTADEVAAERRRYGIGDTGGTRRNIGDTGGTRRNIGDTGGTRRNIGDTGGTRRNGDRPRDPITDTAVLDIDSSVQRSRYDEDLDYYRTHYDRNLSGAGPRYDHYAPAYRFGSRVAREDTYDGLTWTDVEAELRRRWEERNPGSWNDHREAIRYSYESERTRV